MLKKTVTYTDFDGNSRTEDFYFNLTQAELTEMQLSYNGGLDKVIKSIVEAKDQAKILGIFKELVLKAYGEKSLDGRHFRKSDQIREEFACTEAYSVIFMELGTDAKKAADFVNALVSSIAPPQNLAANAR